MSCRHGVRTVLTLCMTLCCGLGVVAHTVRLDNNGYFDDQDWNLVPAENKVATSVSDLTDGVYLIELSEKRPLCIPSKGPGMVIREHVSCRLEYID